MEVEVRIEIVAVEGVEHPGLFSGDVRVAEVLTHFHHQLIARGLSVKKTVLISYAR